MTSKRFEIIDLESPNVKEQILRGAKDTGIFYVKNHGVNQDTIDQMFAEYKKFFDLPYEKKMECKQQKGNMTGYTCIGGEIADDKGQADTKEGYLLRIEENPGLKRVNPQKFTDHQTLYPDAEALPNLKPAATQYLNEQWDLGQRIIHLIADCLNLPTNYFDSKYKDPFASVKSLHYTSDVSDPDKGRYACGQHTDWGMLTILISDENDGLQLFDEEQEQWFDVKPIPGTFIVFVGDMLKGITGGYFRSAIHRVVNKRGVERYSFAFFCDPDLDATCEQIPTLKEFVKRPYEFPFKTYGQYAEYQFNRIWPTN